MTFDEYMVRFRLLQHAVDQDEMNRKLLVSEAYQGFVERFADVRSPLLRRHLDEAERNLAAGAKRRRICERYALRIARAIERIPQYELREYARFHYLYGFSNEDIADASFFSVRTVYRHATEAKKELIKRLLEVSPRLRRPPSGRFRVKGRLVKRDYSVGRRRRSVAAVTAKRKSVSLRPLLF